MMPKYVMIDDTAVHLWESKGENLARYYRARGHWYINVLRRPTGELVACHEPPFPESIAEAIVKEIDHITYRENDS